MARQAFVVPMGPAARDDRAATRDDRAAGRDDRAAAAPDLRTALRRATAELHRHLDRAPEQRALLAPGLTLERYASIMSKHRRALAVGESVLATVADARPTGVPPYRPRLPALEADLATLGGPQRPSARSEAPAGAPPVFAAPPIEAAVARGRYLGTRYVLEGSTQGAAFIAPRLQQHLPALAARAFGYWRLQAQEAPAWEALSMSLASLPARGPAATAAIAAAREAFVAFLHAFDLDVPEASDARTPGAPRMGAPR